MDDKQDAVRLALLERELKHLRELYENLKTQEGRTHSHFESEKTHRGTVYTKINDAMHLVHTNQNKIIDHDKEFKDINEILFNKGSGIVFQVRDFKKYIENNNATWKTIGFWLTIIMSAISLYIAVNK